MGTPGDASPPTSRPAVGSAGGRSATTRELITSLAATEDALRDPGCSAVLRRELAHAQVLIVRELRTRKIQWRRP